LASIAIFGTKHEPIRHKQLVKSKSIALLKAPQLWFCKHSILTAMFHENTCLLMPQAPSPRLMAHIRQPYITNRQVSSNIPHDGDRTLVIFCRNDAPHLVKEKIVQALPGNIERQRSIIHFQSRSFDVVTSVFHQHDYF
jgi:hypothetical protein